MPRTGSTSLFHILGNHPAVFRPFRKEMGYFLFNHHKGERWYLRAYAGASNDQRCIDVTPEYFFAPVAIERMQQFGDGLRVVIGVRNPASFAASLHGEYAKRYRVPPLAEFVRHYAYRRGSAQIEFFLASGTIRTMLEAYRTAFPGRVLFYDYAAFASNPLSVLQSIERYAGLPSFFNERTFTNAHMNRGDRSNVRWFSALLSAEPLIDAASALLPANALRRVARMVYGRQTDTGAPKQSAAPPPDWLRALFEEDERYIEKLFGGDAVVMPQA